MERTFRVFEVDAATAPPSFVGTSPVVAVTESPAELFDAVAFDTPRHDLAGRGITLRRTPSGWQLTVPTGVGVRTEVLVQVETTGGDPDAVPAELTDRVLAVVRDRPLTPVAHIHAEYSIQLLSDADGSVVAELHDRREITGDHHRRVWFLGATTAGVADDILLDRLSSAASTRPGVVVSTGSAPVPEIDPLHRTLAEQVDELLVWDRAVRVDADDAVHQLRVTIRRIRSLLQAAAETLGVADADRVAADLRWLAGVLGVARDAEVLAQRYQRALDRLSSHLVRGRARERLVEAARRRYQEGHRESVAAMRSTRYFRLLDRLDAIVAGVSGAAPVTAAPPTVDATAAAVDAAYRKICKAARAAARAADDTERDQSLHRLRKAAKRLRYTAAAIDAGQVVEQAKTIQTLLGDHQDSVVSRAHLLEEADAARAAGEDTFTYGLLYQQEDDLAQRCRALLDAALGRLDDALQNPR